MTSTPAEFATLPSRAAGAAREHVLIVDDIDINLLALEATLEDMGCSVVTARTGEDALRRLLRQQFALMLLDVQMPAMDGYEVAFYAKQNPETRDIPIIFLTATQPTEQTMLRGYAAGAVDFLFKPLNPTVLRGKVRVFLDLHRSRREISEGKAVLERTNAELAALARDNQALADGFRASNLELERAYRELQSTQSQLVQSAKMASLGELVAGVAHEINNPLAFALSHLGTARRSLDQVRAAFEIPPACRKDWDRAEHRLAEMNLGLERIRELVVKLRTFSRIDEGEWKRVGIHECVDALLTILGHRLTPAITIRKRIDAADTIDCMPSLLTQAMMNLLTNALDAVGETGAIDIDAHAEGEWYSISVSDSGPGIPPAIRERVLEPFFTTKPVGQGTGLGLSITYSIVKRHGGTLELGDADGSGTRATIRIPTAGLNPPA